MNLKKYQAVLEVLLVSIILFTGHKLFFVFSPFNKISQTFNFSIETLYTFFALSALMLLLILIKVKQKNLDYVGHTFVLLTFIKMALAYIFLYTILNSNHENLKIEKINFFVTFAIFLLIETIITVRLLNEKEQK